ncbi:MAG: helix-turn-helix transcriptional regulator, partial [Bacteroidales bacterium]|nr:helix-turn-helix transcriptional regulator [Bacteroidales bacterium]
VYKRSGKQKLALQFCENYYILKDSLTGIHVKEKIADLEIKHQTEKKQQEIELLNEENNTKRQKIKARNRLIISLVLLVIVIIGIANFFRQRARQKLNQMESDIQKYILKIKDLNSIEKDEPEITSKEFSIKYELTERETEVLHLISEGMPNADIGKKIFVSTNTVKYHIKNIYLKLDVKNRVEALNKIKQ